MTTGTDTLIQPYVTKPALMPAKRANGWMVFTPIVVSLAYAALLAFKPTRRFALQMSDENYPIELGTFALLIAGGIYGIRLAVRTRRENTLPGWAVAFYMAFAVLLVLVGMEEVSWGQWFFHFRTPESIARINTQGEFTLHNLNGIGGNTVWLRLAFGLAGFVGIALGSVPRFRAVAVPPRLWAWFAVITAFAAGDVATDYAAANSPVS